MNYPSSNPSPVTLPVTMILAELPNDAVFVESRSKRLCVEENGSQIQDHHFLERVLQMSFEWIMPALFCIIYLLFQLKSLSDKPISP